MEKRTEKILQKYGDDHYKRIGQKGGLATVPKGFGALDPERRKEIQQKAIETRRRNKLEQAKREEEYVQEEETND